MEIDIQGEQEVYEYNKAKHLQHYVARTILCHNWRTNQANMIKLGWQYLRNVSWNKFSRNFRQKKKNEIE